MKSYILKRLILTIPVLWGISLIVFFIMALIPGDPASAILGAYATPENVARLREELGLNKSLLEQYIIWLTHLFQGDLGQSYSLNRPVLDEVLERLGPTLLLAGTALVLCTFLGLLAGSVSAVKQYGWQDKLLTLLVLMGISTPSFWLGLILVLLFAVQLQWFPASGMFAIYGGGGVVDLLHHLILPAITLAVVATGVVARLTRTNMLEVLRQDYVRTARAKGLKERQVIYKHAFKNALVNIIPVIGIQAGFVLGGAVYIETVFEWPGIGRMLVTAITTRDILLVQGGVLLVAASYVFFNLLADVAQHALDPRLAVNTT
jgi:peptide/nickel transport system permease protein